MQALLLSLVISTLKYESAESCKLSRLAWAGARFLLTVPTQHDIHIACCDMMLCDMM